MPRDTQTSRDRPDAVAAERPELLAVCGLAGLVGNIAPIVTLSAASVIVQHDFVADTISDLARGPHKWIMDTGFYLSAVGLLGLAIAAAHVHLGRWAWSAGIFCLAGLALVVVLLGLWDQFGTDPSDWSVHTWLTFLLGPLYFAGPLLMAKGAARVDRVYGIAFPVAACLWLVFATAFKLAPDAYDGLLEKFAVVATLLWTVPLSILFLRRGKMTGPVTGRA
jgi:hypothetical protein